MRRTREENHDAAIRLEPQAGRGAAIIFKDGGAFGNHGLAHVHFGHGAANLAKARLDHSHHGRIAREFAAEQFGHGVARAIVLGGAKASAGDDEFDALCRFVEGVAQGAQLIADHRFPRDFDAEPIELRGEEKGIGVDPVRGQQFRSDCDDFSFHSKLTWKRKAFHFPIDGEERAAGG